MWRIHVFLNATSYCRLLQLFGEHELKTSMLSTVLTQDDGKYVCVAFPSFQDGKSFMHDADNIECVMICSIDCCTHASVLSIQVGVEYPVTIRAQTALFAVPVYSLRLLPSHHTSPVAKFLNGSRLRKRCINIGNVITIHRVLRRLKL